MDTESIQDLKIGPVILKVDEYMLVLSLNHLGEPVLEVSKNGSPIRSIPNKLKDNESIKALKERVKQLRRQVSRLRKFLEKSMCNNEEYSWTEFQELMGHPILKPMMEQLVFVSPKGMGFPIQSGKVLLSYDGTEFTLDDRENFKDSSSL